MELKYDVSDNLTKGLPFSWILGRQRTNIMNIHANIDETIGRIERIKTEDLGVYHEVVYNDKQLDIYSKTMGKYEYDVIVIGDIQVAMIIHYIGAFNRLGEYTIYLLDEYQQFDSILAMYCMYKYKFYDSGREEVVIASYSIKRSYGYISSDKYFDDDWLADNFGLDVVNFSDGSKHVGALADILNTLIIAILIIAFFLKKFLLN